MYACICSTIVLYYLATFELLYCSYRRRQLTVMSVICEFSELYHKHTCALPARPACRSISIMDTIDVKRTILYVRTYATAKISGRTDRWIDRHAYALPGRPGRQAADLNLIGRICNDRSHAAATEPRWRSVDREWGHSSRANAAKHRLRESTCRCSTAVQCRLVVPSGCSARPPAARCDRSPASRC